jgi:dienelactone hydrolase
MDDEEMKATYEYWSFVNHEVADLGLGLQESLNRPPLRNASTHTGIDLGIPMSPAWSTQFPGSSTVKITWNVKYDDTDDHPLYDLYMPEEVLNSSNGTGLKIVVFLPGKSNDKSKQKFACQMLASWGRICMALQFGNKKMDSAADAMMYAGIANWTSNDDKTYPKCKDTCTSEDGCKKWACTGCPKCYVNEVDLIGYSDGGITAFNMALDDDYNSYFSKAVIISGAHNKNGAKADAPPMLVIHCMNDPIVSFSGAEKWVEAQEKTGAVIKHHFYDDGYHRPFKWADWAWEVQRFLTDPQGYNDTHYESEAYFGKWETISETAGCLQNDENITPFASYSITKQEDLCQGLCEEIDGCRAIDYLVGLSYLLPRADDNDKQPNCYLYYKACENPLKTFHTAVTITSSKLNLSASVAFPVREATPVEK